MNKKLLPMLEAADALPFLFVGSGISKRYLEIPTWFDLVKEIAMDTYGDEYKFEAIRREAEKSFNPDTDYNKYMSKLVDLVEKDLENIWITDDKFAHNRKKYSEEYLKKHTSVIKIEIAELIKKYENIIEEKKDEFEMLKAISEKSISGVITTNYDELMEKVFDFEVYESQQELIFHAKYNVGEVYKIHGSVNNPSTIMINSNDYKEIEEKNKYIASKLLTIFIEHPIIFLGYSMQDEDILHILEDIQISLSEEQLKIVAERMFFIEWNETKESAEIGTLSINFSNGRSITVTKIELDDYSELYSILAENKAKYPVKMLRYMKEDIYNLVLTNDPKGKMLLSLPNEEMSKDEIKDVEFVYGFGVIELAKRGYSSPTPPEVYRDILLDDANYIPEAFLTQTLPQLSKIYGKMPGYKYFKNANMSTKNFIIQKGLLEEHFIDFKTQSILKRPHRYHSVEEVIANEKSLQKQLQALETLTEEEIDIDRFQDVLVRLFKEHQDIFATRKVSEYTSTVGAAMRRLVRELDYLKYKS
ncbi:SIR2 family protein [Lactococcus lactis]|uniref:SIR2 family protein n=1 Tax=Lactococcus lactis TaxID=1358 RepID=UPI00223B5639|nr:SIR2 family protein [Lactococcus lactis]MCT0077749.1 hypothetical protein [Lactococcus lactis subsp. lactis]